MKQRYRILFFILFFVRTGLAHNIVLIYPNFRSIELGSSLSYFVDATNTKNIHTLHLNKFLLYPKKSVNLGLTGNIVWLMFHCKSKCNHVKHLVLDIDDVYSANVNFYVFEKSKLLRKYENYDWKTKLKNRVIKTRYFAFPLEIKPNQELRVIFSIQEKNGFLFVPATLYEKNLYEEQYERFDMLYSIPIIFIGIISLITFILWIGAKEQILVYYFLYQFGFLIYALNNEGIMAQYFPTFLSSPIWYVYGITISYSGNLLFALKFILISLKKDDYKGISIIVYSYIGFSLVWCLFLTLMNFEQKFTSITTSIASFSYVLIFAIALFGLIKKAHNAKLYFFATLPFLLSALLIRIVVLDFINLDLNFISSEVMYLMNYYAPLFEVILLGLGLIFFFRREREKLLMSLLDIEKQKLHTQETERRRIAQDLHDDLGGTLSAIKGRMSNESTAADTISLIEKAIEDLRLISRNLMPSELANEGLTKAISHTIERLQSASQIKFIYIIFGKEVRLSEEQELNIYRIVAEMLNNIIKHSKATEVVLQFIFYEQYLFISLEDNGIGIKTDSNTWGIGLKNINSRIAFLKAKLITDSSNKGTTFIIEIPYS